ncbi:MAG TPA: hypothetical protein DCM59_07495 [Clostridium sp.]|jgi:hypothetical protein|uniref:hypothetical protein n=1 Tax=unclassified Clostridium TaxID=2614128 RepID=UPI000EF05C12|nr:hypothetical protein [Clostridium sp.]
MKRRSNNYNCNYDDCDPCDCDCNNNNRDCKDNDVGGVVDAKEVRCQRKEDRLLILILILLYCQNVSTNCQYYRCMNSELLNYVLSSHRQLMCTILCMTQSLVDSAVDCCANQKNRK